LDTNEEVRENDVAIVRDDEASNVLVFGRIERECLQLGYFFWYGNCQIESELGSM